MEKIKRNRLKKGDAIYLSRKKDGTNAEECKILAFAGEGGSSLCYSALYEGKSGRLKEFYPVNYMSNETGQSVLLERTKEKRLVPRSNDSSRRFKTMCEDFVSAYELLEAAKNGHEQNEVLNNYMPPYHLLYGSSKDGEGTSGVYVWTPDDKMGESFQDYLTAVRKRPKKLSVHKLYNIISTIITLTDCIKALHSAGLLHLDIKPSNFLVTYNSMFEINTSNISLFDINTLYAVESSFPTISGTEGFMAPEVAKGNAENRSDIYSIGAMLFYAVIISDEIEDGLYRNKYYPCIEQLVNDSELMNAAEPNKNVFLRFVLSKILKKCLAGRAADRYACCEELIADLKQAQTILLPEVVSGNLSDAYKKLELVDVEGRGESNSTVIIQNLLFEHPLIPSAESISEQTSELNILVVGAGTYAQKFIDISLQAGQIPGYEINITAVTKDPDYAREVYLKTRPAMGEFVNVDGSLDNCDKEIYGNLKFMGAPGGYGELSTTNPDVNREIAEEIMLQNGYQYIFIALGDDKLNQEMAKIFVDISKELELKCSVNFVVQYADKKKYRKGNPVYVNETVSFGAIHSELERIAFNTHLSWADSLNVDMRREKSKFYERYNYESSMAFALSIQYKLRSLGITGSDWKEAAKSFRSKIRDKKIFGDMIACEHRRWVMEKVTAGWFAPKTADGRIDYDRCGRKGMVKDKIQKLHPCIVRSTNKLPLYEYKYKANNHAKWDDEKADDSLDALDRMSIELHQYFRKKAEELKNQHVLQNGDMAIIKQRIIHADASVMVAYNHFLFCLKNILNGSQGYSKQYDYYEETFKKALSVLPEELKKEIHQRLKRVKTEFFPVVESNMYRDYKSYDEILVKKIPFILTHVPLQYAAMAFSDGKNDELFRNAASVIVINPSKMNYLYYFDGTVRAEDLAKKIRSVLNFFDSRNVYAQIHFSVAVLQTPAKNETEKLTAEFEKLIRETRLNTYTLLECADEDDAIKVMMQSLASKRIDLFDGSVMLFASQLENSKFTNLIYEKYPYFEFKAADKAFVNCKGCEYLTYIEDKSYIRIHDMFALRNASDSKFNFPEFAADYEDLWEIYTGNYRKGGNKAQFGYSVMNWNRMCEQLEKYAAMHDKIAEFNLDPREKSDKKQFTYFFPDFGYKTADFLLKRLGEYGLITAESTVSAYTSDTCRAEIYTEWKIEKELEKLFSRTDFMADERLLRIEKIPAGKSSRIVISFDNLSVDSLKLEENDRYSFAILEKLAKAHFITRLRQDEKNKRCVSFAYTSPRMKKLLTTAGEILEIYTYYEALKTGYFDDIACGFEFEWEFGGVKNEIDGILTKGFRSLMIECKGRKRLEQDFYHKLQSISEQFGIGCKKVLIANTYMHNEFLDAGNDEQKARGNQMEIITVSDPDDILNIGYTLRKIIEGRF